jgi:hypothetical protein
MESMPGPGRARHLIPTGLPHRRRLMAACAVVILLAHLLLAQLTLGLALALAVTGRMSRWRLWWLTAPAAAGLVWALAIGPAAAGAGFAAGPAHVFGYLSRGDLLERLSRPAGLFAGAGSWLPRQLPVALIAAAAEAALIGWLDWLRTDESTARPRRPGVIAAVRARLAASVIRAGAVVTRDGCALGVDPATGAQVELRWPEAAGGVLVAGAADRDVAVAGLQVVHAALRRRKPLIVVDVSADAAIARALAAACAATGTALRHERADADLGPVIIERSAALLRVGSPESAARACAGISALAAGLRRIGVNGDALVWVTGGERLTAPAVAALIGDGRACGLAVMVGAASPATTADLAGLVATLVVHRVADPSLAATLAAQAGPRLSARALLTLGQGEFALAVKAPRPRLVALGRSVPARLPRYTDVRRERVRRRLRYGPA